MGTATQRTGQRPCVGRDCGGGGGGVYYPGVVYDPYSPFYSPYYGGRYANYWSPYGFGYGLGYFSYDPFLFGGYGYGDPYGYDSYGSAGGGGYGYGGGYGDPYQGGGASSGERYRGSGSLRLKVKPADAQVFVDGYFIGVVDSFDGAFQRLGVEAGAHKVQLKAEGYEPTQFDVMVTPGETVTYKGEMKRIH
ncbi:MAG: PEGA domain-containing protein [Acidobacteriota bacterium]